MSLHDSIGLVSPEHRPRQRAFTMIELVIVMLIVGILAAAAAPRYVKAMDANQAKAAAMRLAGDLKYARQLAKQTSTEQQVIFDIDTNRYELLGAKLPDHRGKDYVIQVDEEFDSEIVSADFNDSESVTFSIHGRTDNEGTVVVGCGNNRWEIKVELYGQVTYRHVEP